ncbi:MAG: 23S rRNA (guanosine(2251)-2'-O)-methyltransferase RlmB [Fidelibacterota bacterium]
MIIRKTNIVFGRNPVFEYLQSGRRVDQLYFHDKIRRNDWMDKTLRLAQKHKVKYSFVPKEKLNSIVGAGNHQGVVAFISPVSYATPEDILDTAKKMNEKPFIVILDSIQDPHNFGAIIRTAVAMGVHGILIPKHGSVSVTDTVFKTSAGTVQKCKIAKVTNLVQAINLLKKEDVWIYGADSHAKQSMNETDFRGGVALVMGSEGKGLHQKVSEHCDFLVSIPMKNKVESLNVSVSAALLINKVFESRQ